MTNWILLSLCLYFACDTKAMRKATSLREGETMLLNCSVDDIADLDTLSSIDIARKQGNSHETTIAVTNCLKSNGEPVLSDHFQNRSRLSGRCRTDYPKESFLQVEVGHLTTADNGTYFCRLAYNNKEGNYKTNENEMDVTIRR